MAYKVGKYLKTSEEYVGGIDPLAKAVQDFPSILARNQAYAVQREIKEKVQEMMLQIRY